MMGLSTPEYFLVTLGFFIVAIMYSSIGHAGASGYTAILALVGFSPLLMRPVSLGLNIVVGVLAFLRFQKAGLINYKKIVPFILGSIPLTYYSAGLGLDRKLFYICLGVVLLYASIKLIVNSPGKDKEPGELIGPKWPLAVVVGCLIGFMSGITGTGGAIFLTPLLLQFRWAEPKAAAGMSVLFVLSNSVSGLLGSYPLLPKVFSFDLLPWMAAVALGALIGTFLGIQRFSKISLRRMLGVVLLFASMKLMLLALEGFV